MKTKTYLAKFPLAFPNVETPLIPVYDLPILALIPSLDYALLALLEQSHFTAVNAIIDRYLILYKYSPSLCSLVFSALPLTELLRHHPFPIRLVYQFLYRLHNFPIPIETKVKLLKIAGNIYLCTYSYVGLLTLPSRLGGLLLTPDFEKIQNPSLSEAEREEMLRSLQTSEHSINICRQVVVSLRYASLLLRQTPTCLH